MTRKPIQSATTCVNGCEEADICVLCDDGTMWTLGTEKGKPKWFRLPDIPQDAPETQPEAV